MGKPISITADQTTFAPGAGNRTDNTFARAELKANSSTNNATEHYYVYLSIDTNEFTYSTEEKTAELILTITDPNGNPLTSINGLNYVTVGEISGFDITESNGLITIANNYEITSTSTKIDEWQITLTLVNLDANQNNNAGKTFNGTLMIQKNAVASQYIASLFTTQGANHLYLHDSTLANSAEDGSIRYAGGDYRVADAYKSTYDAISKIIRVEMDSDATANPNGYNRFYLAYESPKVYYPNMRSALAKAITDGYIVADSVDNYVCFGTDNENCDNDHLYRIIGAYGDNIKLIKADMATEDQLGTDGDFYQTWNSKEDYNNNLFGFENLDDIPYKGNNNKWSYYYWNKINYNQANTEKGKYHLWSYSELNKTNLNKNYLNNLGTKWSNMIDETIWYVGGMNSNIGWGTDAKTVYDSELGVNKNVVSPYEPYKAKVGLMYLSEYYYSASPGNWTLPGSGPDWNCLDDYCILGGGTDYTLAVNDNWMYTGDQEWTISPYAGYSSNAFVVTFDGLVGSYYVNGYFGVRPSFNLKSSVTFNGGSGSATDPYRIK